MPDCGSCHGADGSGVAKYPRLAGQCNDSKDYPVVAAQHHGTLLREVEHVRDGERGNSQPAMVKSLSGRSAADLQALASHKSRLPDPLAAAR